MKQTMVCMATGFIVGSLAYNLNSDNETVMGMTAVYASWIALHIGTFLGALTLGAFSVAKKSRLAWYVLSGVLLAVVGKMAYDSTFTTSTHNLAGMELIVYTVICLPAAFGGAYAAQFILWLSRRGKEAA